VTSAAAQGKAGGGWFTGGESWKTYLVLVVSAIILAGVMLVYVSRSFEAMDRETAVAEMGLLAATVQTIDQEMGGFRLAQSERNDATIVKLLREVAAGMEVVRNDQGEIVEAKEAGDAGAPRLFVEPVPEKSITGASFHFVFPDPASKEGGGLPTIEVEGIGKLRPPEESEDRWVFDGDLTHVHRRNEAGGEIVPVNIKKGDGESMTLTIFKPRSSTDEAEGEEGS